MDAPITKFGAADSMTVFDDVFIPNERVFLCGEQDYGGQLALLFALYHRHSYTGCKPAVTDIMMGASPLLNSVMEEKTQRIAEIILGSVKPFEFMMGKVLAGVAVALTGSGVYVVLGSLALAQVGFVDFIPFHVLPWFFIYMLAAIVMFGSVNAALGAMCNEPKDAQNLMFPAILPVMFPMFILMPVLKEPLAGFATWFSLFPPFTAQLMMLRLSSPAGIPFWQPWVALVGMMAFTMLAVWAGGRVFRIGILMQGTPPKLSNILRWAARG